jgi:hypothetical protein
MSTKSFSRCLSLYLSISLLVAPLPLSAAAQSIIIPISEIEADIVTRNPNTSYVYCGAEFAGIIAQLSALDHSDNSPLHIFQEYVTRGPRLVEYNAVVETLAYAEHFLQNNKQLNSDQVNKMGWALDRVIDQVVNGELTVSKDHHAADTRTIAIPASLEIFELDETSASLFAKRLVAKTPAVVVATANVTLSGLSTIDGVSLATNDRVLLTGQTNPVENGLWEAQSGSWTRPADFASASLADQAYVLISSGSTNAGSSWLCTTPLALVDINPITFVLFAYADVILGANVGAGSGLVFRDKTGTTLNFKSVIAGNDIVVTNNADDITIDTDATTANTASTIVKRNASGNFSAGAISMTDAVMSSSVTVTPFSATGIVHNNASGVLSSSLIVNADISASAAIADSKLATLTTAGKVANAATTANSSNLANAIVSRDGSGNFAAGTITATLNGNAASATSATTATTTTDFTGSLAGDVTGTQSATVVSFVGGQAAANVATSTIATIASTSNNTASAIVRRNASGNFSAGAISVTDAVLSSSLKVTPFATAGIVHNAAGGLLSSSLIVNADISASAAIVDTKLATISTAGKVANSATTATSLNTASAIVARDASGNINASNVIANVVGSASNNILKAGDTMTGALQLPAGSAAAPAIMFTGSTTTGLSATSGNLIIGTNGLERMRISSGGTVSIKAFTSAGIVKNDASGNLSSSLIVDSNIASGAGIVDTKLATISTAGKVANSATTATDLNTGNSLVNRDSSGNFSANVVSVVDVVTSGNLILSTDPSTSTTGHIFKGAGTPFIHNFGTDNTFVGTSTGNFTMSGNGQNSVFGSSAFTSNSSGNNNTAIGFGALPSCTTGNNNIVIGSIAGSTLTTGSGNIYVNANAASGSEATTTRIGTSQNKCFIAGIRGITTGNANAIAVLVDSAGQLGTVSSSRAVKHDIEDMGALSDNVLNLRPVSFVYNDDASNTKQFGLIAEEVAEILPEIVVKDDNDQPQTIQYHILPVLLLNEVKKQQTTIDQMKDVIAGLQEQVAAFVARVKTLENRA